MHQLVIVILTLLADKMAGAGSAVEHGAFPVCPVSIDWHLIPPCCWRHRPPRMVFTAAFAS